MDFSEYKELRKLMQARKWNEALKKINSLIIANPLASNLYLIQAELIQLQGKDTSYTLNQAEAALLRAYELNSNNVEVLVDLMHFYDAVMGDSKKAVKYAKMVRFSAKEAMNDADEIMVSCPAPAKYGDSENPLK